MGRASLPSYRLVLRYALAWPGLLVLAVLNGTVREFGYGPVVGEKWGQQVSVVPAILLFLAYTAGIFRRWPIGSYATALWIGLVWMVLTVAFELFMVTVLMGEPLSVALNQYDLAAGQLWPVVVAATFFLPCFVTWLNKTKDR